MPRKSSVWFREQDGYYYTTVRREQKKLSKDEREAERLYHELMAREEPDEPPTALASPTFRKLADKFLDNSLRVNKPTTSRMHKVYLQSFLDRIGRKRVRDLKVHHVGEWITATGWGESTACSARGTVLAVLNWAVEQGYIDRHPLGKLKRGSHKRRERVFTAEEMRKIVGFVKPDFADFLRALELTGARPFSELALLAATADGWDEAVAAIRATRRIKPKRPRPGDGKPPRPGVVDWAGRTVTFGEHKNEKKGKTRTIYLVPELVAMLERLAERHPTGPLFRNSLGGLWTSHDATRRLHHATRKLGIPRGTVYAVRHKVINDGLEKGLSANVIAELVGNSPVTISRHYDHLSKRKAAMLEAAEKVVS
jgi:integrase